MIVWKTVLMGDTLFPHCILFLQGDHSSGPQHVSQICIRPTMNTELKCMLVIKYQP